MIEESLWFDSDGLSLEAGLSYAEICTDPRAKVLLCPPHPFLGGDMDNNVLENLCYTLVKRNFVVMRFNYRGIGGSETDRDLTADQEQFWSDSRCPEYEALIHRDCQAAFNKLAGMLNAVTPVFVVGYSFGCLPALQIANHDQAARLALISPPLVQWEVDPGLLQNTLPKMLFYSTDDFAAPEERVLELFQSMNEPRDLMAFRDADHFFIGQEQLLSDAVCRFLSTESDHVPA